MPKISKEPEEKIKRPERVYSEIELRELDALLKTKYTYNKTLSNGQIVSLIDYEKYHKDQKSMSASGAVRVEYDVFGNMRVPIRYLEVENRLRQWSEWKGRKIFAREKMLEDLEKRSGEIASHFSVDK